MSTPTPAPTPDAAPAGTVTTAVSTVVYAIRYCLATGGSRGRARFGDGLDLIEAHLAALSASDRHLLAADLAAAPWPYAQSRASRLYDALLGT